MATENLIPDAQRFYTALAKTNTREWWQANKATYDTQLKAPAQSLLADLTPLLAEMADAPVTSKIFRPHRDVRFSKDKTPYTTHLHMMWQIQSDGHQKPVFFFGIGVDYVTVGAGMMGFDKPMLATWRTFADLDHPRINGILSDITSQGYALREPALKRIPPAFGKDHPAGDLLRRKGLVASQDIGHPTTALPDALLSHFNTLWPLNALLIQIAEA